MAVNYTGVATATQFPSTPPTTLDDPVVSIPVDLTDDVAAASVAQGFKVGLDYITLLKNILKAEFGDGSDGNVTISTTVTLTRHMYYDTLTVQAGADLQLNGWRVYCKTGLVWTGGKISINGGAASGVTPGGGGATEGPHLRGKGGAGGTGAVAGTSANTIGATPALETGGSGGSSTGGAIAGGSAAGGSAHTDARGYKQAPHWQGSNSTSVSPIAYAGAPGGGGGGGAAAGNGGGGGQGAGHGFIFAKSITISGSPTSEAIGGAGANASGGNAGGGGGGSGGAMFAFYLTLTGAFPAVTATAGASGTGAGTGAAGGAVSSGSAAWLTQQLGA